MKLYIQVIRGLAPHTGPASFFEKEVNWPCAPRDGGTVFVGKDKDGTPSSINAHIRMVEYCSYGEGSMTVNAVINNCGDEYYPICESLLRDDFTLLNVRH